MAIRQVRMIPSGVQKWHRETIATTSDAFAYSSTMSLHIYRLKDNRLSKMIAAHERAITSICWSPNDSNLLASCSLNKRIAIWDIASEEEQFFTKVTDIPLLMDWAPTMDSIAFCLETGQVSLWHYRESGDKHIKLFSVGANGAKVLRWHPRHGKLLVGTADGAIHVHSMQTNKKVTITGKSKTSKDPVTDAQWDALSDDYVLAAFADGSMFLFDASSQQEIFAYDIQAQAIRSLAWARSQPGNFVTTTDRVGVLRLWNVSQRAPLQQIKVGSSGVNCIKAIPSEPNWFMLSFKNSSVGICDIASRTLRFVSSPGHSETIFDVVFHPEDPDVLATASYDGHVKLWRISTSENQKEMFAGRDQILYGLAFGPGASRICAVSGQGNLFIWRTDTGAQEVRLQVHDGQAYRCEWKHQGSRGGKIITGGADNCACVVDAQNGTIIRKISHPSPVVGVVWHPFQDNVLATASNDAQVRVFNLTDVPSDQDPRAQVVLIGHGARVFNIAFHPICPNILASGSDDRSIRIWNVDPEHKGPRELRRLVGHTAFVRGLVWHTELPYILLSGSWDSTIRVWDVAQQRCLHVSHEHYADVYGVCLHPQRPFFLASSSRDTTLRFWVLEDLVRPLLMSCLVQPWRIDDILGGDIDEVMQILSAPHAEVTAPETRLYGQASRALASSLKQQPGEPVSLDTYRRIASFFMYRQGIEDVWGLLAVVRGEKPLPPIPGISGDGSRSAYHESELIACHRSKALEMASSRGNLGIAGKQEERLLKAAQIMLRIGDIRQYCRFTAQAGHWERAICIAPAVSQQFWRDLCGEYCDTLSAATDMEECAPFWIAAGRSSRLVDASIARSELDNAFVVAKAEADGLLPKASAIASSSPPPPPLPCDGARSKLENVAATLASRYADQAEPLQAAMCYLAVSQSALAISVLTRSHETVLAYIVADVLGQPKDPVDIKLLAQCAEREGRVYVAADLLQQHPRGLGVHLPLLASQYPDEDFAHSFSDWSSERHLQVASQALDDGDIATAVLHFVCGGDHAQAAQVGVDALMALFPTSGWTMEQARAIMDPLEALPLQEMEVKHIANILACASYVGLLEARELEYTSLMFPLAQTLRNIVMHQQLSFPVSMACVTLVEASATSRMNPKHSLSQLNTLLSSADLPAELRPHVEQQIAAIQAQPVVDDSAADMSVGLSKMVGSELPMGYKRFAKTSVLTNQLIKGPAFELEDKKLHVGLADAHAWARVNGFSPLNTGFKINPL